MSSIFLGLPDHHVLGFNGVEVGAHEPGPRGSCSVQPEDQTCRRSAGILAGCLDVLNLLLQQLQALGRGYL